MNLLIWDCRYQLLWNGWWRNIFWILSPVGIGNKSGFNILWPWYFHYTHLAFWKDLKSKLLPASYYTIIIDTRLGNVKFRIADISTLYLCPASWTSYKSHKLVDVIFSRAHCVSKSQAIATLHRTGCYWTPLKSFFAQK